MLRRLCFRPSTNSTSLIKKVFLSPIVHLPRILPLLLSPYVTWPSFLRSRLTNLLLSPVMCLEQSLSRYHIFLLTVKEPCKKQDQGARFCPPYKLGSIGINWDIRNLRNLRNPFQNTFRNRKPPNSAEFNNVTHFHVVKAHFNRCFDKTTSYFQINLRKVLKKDSSCQKLD